MVGKREFTWFVKLSSFSFSFFFLISFINNYHRDIYEYEVHRNLVKKVTSYLPYITPEYLVSWSVPVEMETAGTRNSINKMKLRLASYQGDSQSANIIFIISMIDIPYCISISLRSLLLYFLISIITREQMFHSIQKKKNLSPQICIFSIF